MRKTRVSVAFVISVCILAAAGGLLASNMAFKLNLALTGPLAAGGAGTGRQLIALPYHREAGVDNAMDLMLDIGHGSIAPVISVTKFNTFTDSLIVYTGRMTSPTPTPFALTPGEGYLVQLNSNVNYVVVGAHVPGLAIALTGPAGVGGHGTGKQLFAPPYNITASNALGLILDIGGGVITPVTSVIKYNKQNDTLIVYTGRMSPTPTPFPLVPGEAYLVQMLVNVAYIPSHY